MYPRVHLAHPLVGKGSYKNFLGDLLKIRGNKNVLALLKKDEIDSEFERQLKSILDDESLVQKFMKTDVRQLRLLTYTNKADSPSKARSEQTKRQFADVQGILSTTTHAVAVSDEVQALNLPHFGNHPKTSKYDIFDRQIYNDFAPKAVKNNPDIVFPEKSMDEAFEMVAKRFRRTTGQRRTRREQFERMMRRVRSRPQRYFTIHSADNGPVSGQGVEGTLGEGGLLSLHGELQECLTNL